MKNLLIALCLMAPSLSMASYQLVTGNYSNNVTDVSVVDLGDGYTQKITITSNQETLLEGNLSSQSFSLKTFKGSKKICSQENSIVVPDMGYLIDAKCNLPRGEVINLIVEQKSGVVQAVHIGHQVRSFFGVPKLKTTSIPNLVRK